jgi:hypothetical protein
LKKERTQNLKELKERTQKNDCWIFNSKML